MQADGHAVGRWRIRRVLRENGQRAQQLRSFVPRTTNSDPTVLAATNRVWVGDITYLPYWERLRQGGRASWPSDQTAVRAKS